MADAGHNLSDVFGLLVAWKASVASKRAPSGRFTYRLRGSSILAALANAVFLLVATGAIGWKSIQRFSNPETVAGITVMVVATIGIFVNGATALLFAAGRKGDLNVRGAFLHLAGDAAVSAGVVISGADPVDRMVVAGSRDEPRHLRGHPVEQMGSGAGVGPHVVERAT